MKTSIRVLVAMALLANNGSSIAGDVIVHLFNYPFKSITSELKELAQSGYSYIQVSPPQLSRGDTAWFGRYQPLDYRVIESPLGNEDDLKELIREARKYKIGIIVDVVFNHMAALGSGYNLSFPPQWAREKYGLSELFNANDFHPAFCIQDYNNTYEVRNGRLCDFRTEGGLPDLDPNSKVIAAQIAYLKKLLDMGAKGFRFDAVKHMEPGHLKILLDSLPPDTINFAEIITSKSNLDRDLTPYLQASDRVGFMDFVLQETLRQAFGYNGDLTALVDPEKSQMALDKSKSIAFTVNHDFPQNDAFKFMIMDPKDEELAYAYIFARKAGIPHVYSDLGQIDGLSSDRWKWAHRNPVKIAMVKFHNLLASKSEEFALSDKCLLAINRESDGVAIINKCGYTWSGDVRGSFIGNYVDLLTGKKIQANKGALSLAVEPRSALLLVKAPR
ncbi:MAG: alpha-amylase family glycosyl hydrolase [Pseudomonadota bacterium]